MRNLSLSDLSSRRKSEDVRRHRRHELHKLADREWGQAVSDTLDLSAGDDEFTPDDLVMIDAVVEQMTDEAPSLDLTSASDKYDEWTARHRRAELHKQMDAAWGPSGAAE